MGPSMCKILGYKYSLIYTVMYSCCECQVHNGHELATHAEHKWFPVAVLPGSSTLEVNFTTAKFEPELFEMTNSVTLQDASTGAAATFKAYGTETVEATVADTIVIAGEGTIDAGTIAVKGFTLVDATPGDGEFTYDDASKTLTFGAGSVTVGTAVEVSYEYTDTDVQQMLIDNRAAAIGEVVAKYPVYSDGTDCTAAGIIGYAYLKIFQARITSQPSLGGSLTLQGTRTVMYAN